MRKYFKKIDGQTRGPNLFTGAVGKKLKGCETKDIVAFRPIVIEPEFKSNLVALDDISSDQRYLRDIILALERGQVSEALRRRSPGKLGYARWLTTANHILRLYASTPEPTDDFQRIVEFAIHVYASSWFKIRAKPLFFDAARHLFDMIGQVGSLGDSDAEAILVDVLEVNGYCLHPENLLATMLTDVNVRNLATQRILLARETPENYLRDRDLKLLNFNFNATVYYDIVHYDRLTWLEPILTKKNAHIRFHTIFTKFAHTKLHTYF